MAGIDDCIGAFAALCTCCYTGAPGGCCPRSRPCCPCRRRHMSDDDFERTVEQLYAPGPGPKPYDAGAPNAPHVIELQPTRSGSGEGRVTTTQPAPRPSMEARTRRSMSRPPRAEGGAGEPEPELEEDRERAILDARKGAKARTRDWIAQQSAHAPKPDVDVDVDARGDRQHQRGPSEPALREQPSLSREGSHRAHQSEGDARLQLQRPAEAHAGPQGRSGRSPEPHLNLQPDPRTRARGDGGSIGRMSSRGSRASGDGGGARVPPRAEIPAVLRPGRPQSSVPTQIPFDLGPVPALGPGHGLLQVDGPSLGASAPGRGAGSAEDV
ncbi:hypothetical protein BD309DRAFT_860018 [Dichomitus squalens]|nr:hypothetical protein BD309DRAFT_860018 [Dichomitus squalens]